MQRARWDHCARSRVDEEFEEFGGLDEFELDTQAGEDEEDAEGMDKGSVR